MQIKVEVSGRHIHLSKSDFVSLFNGESLTKVKDLSQADEFSAKETVKIIGPKTAIDRVRVVGPFRDETQLELSYTDCRTLGIEPVLKLSGDLPGQKVSIATDKSQIERNCAIVAKRHLHLSPTEAEELKLSHEGIVSAKIDSDRAVIYKNIIVRVEEDFNKSFHLDTDEANAAGVPEGGMSELIIE